MRHALYFRGARVPRKGEASTSSLNGHFLKLDEPHWPVPDREHLRDFWFEATEVSGSGTTFTISLDGWVVGRTSELAAIEVGARGRCVWRLPINVHRPDVEALHSDVGWSRRSGFRHFVSALKLPPDFEADVVAIFADGSRSWISTIRGTRKRLATCESCLSPLDVTTLGRTGSTWVLAVLASHPEIVGFRPFEYETKLARYWTDILGTLCEPASYRQSLSAELYGPHWWIGTEREAPPPSMYDMAVEAWLGGRHVEQVANLCGERVNAFYELVASRAGKPAARYFAEKGLPGTFRQEMMPELYSGYREIFLVRDFRDMATSMLEFDRRREFRGFLREEGETDEDWLRGELRRDIGVLARSWEERSSNAFLLRYEDLVREPRKTLSSLLRYLDLDRRDRVIEAMLTDAQVSTPSTLSRRHQTSRTPAESIGRWQREAPETRALCEEVLGDLLDQFGYR